MKHLLLFLAILIYSPVYSQWTWQNPWPQGNHLNAAYASDSQHCWMVGDFGVILLDDGNTIDFQKSGTTNNLNAVHFFDNQEGWAGGENGIILHYANGIWEERSIGLTSAVNAFFFLNKDLGWAVGGGQVLRYENGVWSLFGSPGVGFQKAIWFDSPQEAWVGGWHGIKHYDGANWTLESIPPLAWEIYWIKRLNDGTLWAGCSYEVDPGDPGDPIYAPRVIKYENGHWILVDNSLLASNAISFVHDSLFVVAGSSWTSKYHASIANGSIAVSSVSMADSLHAWAVGENGGISFFNGEVWQDKSRGFYQRNLQDIEMFSEKEGIAVARYSQHYYKLADGVWEADLMHNCYYFDFRDIDFIGPSFGWGVGTSGRVWNYTDNGFNCDTDNFIGTLNSVTLIDTTTGWVGNSKGDIIKIDMPWATEFYDIGDTKEINKIHFSTPDEGWAVGWDSDAKQGFLYHFSNGNWSENHVFPQMYLAAFFMNAPDDIWVAGGDRQTLTGSIGHFDGQSWSFWEDFKPGLYRDIHFTNPGNGWAIGDYGKIYHFDGQSWELTQPLTKNNFRKIFFTDEQTGWIVGDNSTILHIINGGAASSTFAPDQDVEKYWIYPNPASDNTISLLSSKKQKSVDLRLIDSQGNTVKQYQNIAINSGLDISQLTPGLYFWIVYSENQRKSVGKLIIHRK